MGWERASTLLWISLLGCAPGQISEDGAVTTRQGGDSESDGDGDPSTLSTTSTGSDDMADADESETDGFTDDGDLEPALPCDAAAPDCPEGQKCVPYSSDGDAAGLDGHKCVDIQGIKEPGEPCQLDGWASATDDCDGASFCLVGGDEAGTCRSLCTNNEDCGPGSECLLGYNDLPTCVDNCDPNYQDCPGEACYLVGPYTLEGNTWTFACMPTELAHDPGEVCTVDNGCAQGLGCVPGSLLPACAGDRCCSAFCDLYDPYCADPALECVALLNQGQGWDPVQGICAVP